MKKYFSSSYLIDSNEIYQDQIVAFDLYYEVEYNKTFNCHLAKRYQRNNVTSVVYYDVEFSQDLLQYHIENYKKGVNMQIYFNISEDQKYIRIYNEGILSEMLTYKYKNKRLTVMIWQDNFYNLIEYRQCIYDDSGTQIAEKIFYPDSWTIHTEKII